MLERGHDSGADFSYILFRRKSLSAENHFPQKITFRRKFREISWKNDFSKLFPRKIPVFPNILGGKIFRGIFPEIFPGKKCTKNRSLDSTKLFGVGVVSAPSFSSFFVAILLLHHHHKGDMRQPDTAFCFMLQV
jgi:hypothetical protein